jgi:hypothetical protein
MSHVGFPVRRPDGSFSVEVGIQMLGDLQAELASRVQGWISNTWMPLHATWTREWQTGSNLGTSRVQVLQYSDEFMAPPQITVGPNFELQLRLRGTKAAKFWKDWLVSRLVPDLKAEFPGIGDLLYIRDCAE